MDATEVRRTLDAVWRIESARLIASLASWTHDLGTAEELAQDALVAALEQWPSTGVPTNPAAWLQTVAKRRAIDELRRRTRLDHKITELARETPTHTEPELPDPHDDLTDEMLRLVFTACHPVLSTNARVALTLRLVGGLTTAEIARAFLLPEPTVAQRITRAKKTLARKRVPFAVPQGPDLAPRLASVLEVVYLIFNEGYTATAGEEWTRPDLCVEALRLGRMIAELAPTEPEVHGLVALLELQASRLHARTGPTGDPVLLLDQDRSRWDRLLIRRGLTALDRALALTDTPGPYVLQAAIAACHARATTPEDTDWAHIADLYAALARVNPSPVVELNRAVAVSMAHGPAAALDLVDHLADDPALARYHLLPAVRGDLLTKLGRHTEAHHEFTRAADLTRNARERALLRQRARDAAARSPDLGGTEPPR
ncbi:RNA polymerase sigma factor [Saccharomonospora glauca]|uniref:RNA polymerase sigma factor n=1 Tax=Saccharomonospora glauca K62 TaxID=928724 RepID=I1D2D0_9PSEU|nr:RNA polymerase sigma factor [Saccharomonospora glauca]EIE99104.1 RNA polymerase sigma factor, sigma-70 family [Saccharomonospora glauca K62]